MEEIEETANLLQVTIEELQKHTSKNDMWIAIHGKVYDVTGFRKEHPGGTKVLENLCGKDSTVPFVNQGHDEDNIEALKKYMVGDLINGGQKCKLFTKEEVQKHNKLSDLWIIINDKVYDVTSFGGHPGGFDLLLDYAGKDATVGF